MDISITPEAVEGVDVGDVFKWQGKNWKITKKTRTAIAVSRHYWFDTLYERILNKLKGRATL